METAEYLIRYGVALTMLVYGVHQFLKPEAWMHYIPESLEKISPIKPKATMRLHALGNFFLGAWLASGPAPFTCAIVVLIWWITILPFAFKVKWDIGMRDLTIISAIGSLIALLR